MESTVWTAGLANGFRIGREGVDSDPHPVISPKNTFIKAISASWQNGYFVTKSNQFYSWGTGQSWRLATGKRMDSPTPQLVSNFPSGYNIEQLVSGDKFGAVLCEGGIVLVWGAGYAHSPTPLELESPAVHIAAGPIELICALEDGRCVIIHRKNPHKYFKIPNTNIVKVAMGTSHYLALSEDGVAYSWGGDTPASGQPGEKKEPTIVPGLPFSIQSVYAYHCNSWFLDIDGSLFYCGTNLDGSLGIGNTLHVRSVQRHPFQFGDAPVIQVACGDDFTLVLNSAGQVFGAGNPTDGRTMVPNPELKTEFQLCTKLNGLTVTQISCGCYSSAALVNGAQPPDIGFVLLRNFKMFRMSKYDVSIVGPNRKRIMLEPSEKRLRELGLARGDILEYRGMDSPENKCMVIGGHQETAVVIKEIDCKIDFLIGDTFSAIVQKYKLVERAGVKLQTSMTAFGVDDAVDPSDEAMEPFNGLCVGDIIDSGLEIAGARGDYLLAYDSNVVLNVIDINSIKSIHRTGHEINRFMTADGRVVFVEMAKRGTIIVDRKWGACELVGKLSDTDLFSCPCDFGLLRALSDDGTFIARSSDKGCTRDCFDSKMEPIKVQISLQKTLPLGVAALDLVITPTGRGTVIGVVDGKVAVLPERNRNNFGAIRLFDQSDILVIGRINSPLERTIYGIKLSVNTEDFNRALPGDFVLVSQKTQSEFKKCQDDSTSSTEKDFTIPDALIKDFQRITKSYEKIGKRVGVVVGAADGHDYVDFGDSLEELPEDFELIMRSMLIAGFNRKNGKNISVSSPLHGLAMFIPGDSIKVDGSTKIFLGVDFDNEMSRMFWDEETNIIEPLSLLDISLPEHY